MVRYSLGYCKYCMQQNIHEYTCVSLEEIRKTALKTRQKYTKCIENARLQRNCNKPPGEESPRSRSTASEPQGSDYSRNTVLETSIPDPNPAHYSAEPETAVPTPYSAAPDMSGHQHMMEVPRTGPPANEQVSSGVSVRDDESYLVPQRSSISAPRMIQSGGSGPGSCENAFKRLRKMGSSMEPTERLPTLPTPGDLGVGGYPGRQMMSKGGDMHFMKSREYHATKFLCMWTTTLMILLALATIVTMVVAIIEVTDECTGVSICLLTTDLFVLIILVVEWIRVWLWREPDVLGRLNPANGNQYSPDTAPNQPIGGGGLPAIALTPGTITSGGRQHSSGGLLTPGFPQRLYDVPQFISAICLILLYIVTLICVCVTLATACQHIGECVLLANCAVGYSAAILILILLRTILCCLSEACQGVLYRTAKATSGVDNNFVPIMSVNQLHGALPGIGKAPGSERVGPPAPWLVNLANSTDPSQTLSIVKPMPARYAHDIA